MSFVAAWKQRSRHEKSIVLGVNDGPQPGSTGGRNDFPQQLTNLQLFNVNKDESFPISLIDSESGTIMNGKVGSGKSTGRMRPPHLPQIGGSYENDTNHNKENGNTSSVDQGLFSKFFLVRELLKIRIFPRVQT